MAVRDAQSTPATPPVSLGIIPQHGAIGSFTSSPSPQMPPPLSGWSVEYRSTTLGHVDLPDDDDDEFGDMGGSKLQSVHDLVAPTCSESTACPNKAQPQLENAVKLSSIICRCIISAYSACYPDARCAEIPGTSRA